MGDLEKISSDTPIRDTSFEKITKFQAQIGEYNGHKISYIGGISCRIEKAQNLSSALEKANTQKQTTMTEVEAQLQDEFVNIESKLGKASFVISDVVQKMKNNGDWEKIEVESSGHKRVYLAKHDEGKIQIISQKFLERHSKELGRGNFGIVYGDSKGVHASVVKQAYQDSSLAERDLLTEELILQVIHQNGTIKGIVRAPKALVKVDENDLRLIGDKFDHDLFELHEKNLTNEIIGDIPQIFRGFSNMFNALKQLHERHIYHGDIKHENIGVFHESYGDPFRLADWGGANLIENDFPKGSTMTAEYCPKTLLLAMNETEDLDRYKTLYAKRDYFALAKCLTESLAPSLLYRQQDYIDIFHSPLYPVLPIDNAALTKSLKKYQHSDEVISLLINIFNACHPDSMSTLEQVEQWVKDLTEMSSSTQKTNS